MPNTGLVLFFLSIHLAAFLIFIGYWIASAGFFPNAIRKISGEYERRPVRATLVGIFTYGPLFLLLISAGKLGGAAILGLLAGFSALVVGLIGTAGLALLIGRNLSKDAPLWNQSLRGSVMLALVFITPFLGSFFLLHIGLASGFGAVLLSKPWKSAAPTTDSISETVVPSLS